MFIKVKLIWTDVEHKAFEQIKPIVNHTNLLTYMYSNKRFEMHTNDIEFQLEVVISQEGKPIALYSRN